MCYIPENCSCFYANLPQTRRQVVELRRQRFIQLYTNYYVFYNITVLVQRSIGCQARCTTYVQLYYTSKRQTQQTPTLTRHNVVIGQKTTYRYNRLSTYCNRKCLNQMYEYGARKVYSNNKYTVWMNCVEL